MGEHAPFLSVTEYCQGSEVKVAGILLYCYQLVRWIQNISWRTSISFHIRQDRKSWVLTKMGAGKIPALPDDNCGWNQSSFPIPLPFWWKHFLWDIGSKFRNKEISGRFSFKWHLVSLLMKGKPYSICWDQISSHQTPQCNYFPTKYLNEDVNEYQGIWSH